MPSFGASQSVSGSAGLNSGPKAGNKLTIAGVTRLEARGTGNRTGPNIGDPSFNSSRAKFCQRWLISGSTLDSVGAALENCAVKLFATASDVERDELVSNASGAFSFNLDGNAAFYYLVAYKAGSPDVTGATVNTLTPIAT